ncbi:MAG TPA: hypothetical protein VN838_05650, partial [Bradyrhizobium sp.]|nr:hypothetical protein [Bradyrhizobium sp.]
EETDPEMPDCGRMRTGVFVLKAWSRHLRFGEMKKAVKDEMMAYRDKETGEEVDEFVIEDKAAGPTLISEMQSQGVRIFAYNPGNASKAERAKLQQEVFDDGLVWVPGKRVLGEDYRSTTELAEWAEEMVAECAMFPNGIHDEYVDVISQGLHRLRLRGSISVTSDLPIEEPIDDDDLPRDEMGEIISPYGRD